MKDKKNNLTNKLNIIINIINIIVEFNVIAELNVFGSDVAVRFNTIRY